VSKELPKYVPMVYIIKQLKGVPIRDDSSSHRRRLSHIGLKQDTTWVALCKVSQESPLPCEYQYRTTPKLITCKDCIKALRETL